MDRVGVVIGSVNIIEVLKELIKEEQKGTSVASSYSTSKHHSSLSSLSKHHSSLPSLSKNHSSLSSPVHRSSLSSIYPLLPPAALSKPSSIQVLVLASPY